MKRKPALLLIDAQKGFHEPFWGVRNNPNAELKMKQALDFFRKESLPVIHIQHLSKEPCSPLRPNQEGVEFLESLTPKEGERIFQKTVNSAFIGTRLESHLREFGLISLVILGFTTDHCVSTTTRMAANLGFEVTILADATATFERNIHGKKIPAELVHEVSLASLQGEFAQILNTEDLPKA